MSSTLLNLYGHVKHQGLPVAQMTVALFDHFAALDLALEAIMTTKTGSKGEFTFAVRPGVYNLKVIPEVSQGTRFLTKCVEQVKVTSNTNTLIALQTGCVVSGAVLAPEYQGELLAQLFEGIEVVALGIEPSSYKSACALDSSGKFSLVLPRGKYNFVLRATKAPHKFNFLSTHSEMVTLRTDSVVDLDLPLLQGFGGEVVDFFGKAVEGALVTLTPSSPGELCRELQLSSETVTTSSGKFQFAVEQGYYDLKIAPAAGSVLFGLNHKKVWAGTSETGVKSDDGERYILLEGHRLRGQVVFEGRLLSQALVRVLSITSTQEFTTRTDEEGQFMLSVPAGSYKIVVVAHPKDAPTIIIEDVSYASLAPFAKTVVVGGDTHVAVKLKQGTALMGRVTDDAGKARPGVNLSIYSQASLPDLSQTLPAESEALVRGITDGEGRYCVFLSAGRYTLVLQRDRASGKRVELGEEPLNLDIVWHGWSQMGFVVSGADGQPVSRCRVTYAPYGQDDGDSTGEESDLSYPHGYVFTQDDGACRLTLPSGVYTFKFIPPAQGSYIPRLIRQLSISADVTRKVTLELKDKNNDQTD